MTPLFAPLLDLGFLAFALATLVVLPWAFVAMFRAGFSWDETFRTLSPLETMDLPSGAAKAAVSVRVKHMIYWWALSYAGLMGAWWLLERGW